MRTAIVHILYSCMLIQTIEVMDPVLLERTTKVILNGWWIDDNGPTGRHQMDGEHLSMFQI